jgi:hypothetical protein
MPPDDWVGTDTFTYRASKDGLSSETQTVHIEVANTIRTAPALLSFTHASASLVQDGSSSHDCGNIYAMTANSDLKVNLTNNSKFKMVLRSIARRSSSSCTGAVFCDIVANPNPITIELNAGETKNNVVAGSLLANVGAPYPGTAAYQGVASLRFAVNVLRDPGGHLGLSSASALSPSQWTAKFLPAVTLASSATDAIYAEQPEIYYASRDLTDPVSITGTITSVDAGLGCD